MTYELDQPVQRHFEMLTVAQALRDYAWSMSRQVKHGRQPLVAQRILDQDGLRPEAMRRCCREAIDDL